ncbi:MAG: GAP family protein [Candidatus Nanopelagicales bacterium]
MWTTVLVLATALNLEPNRLALIALMLIRPRPIRQLLAFLTGSFLTSATAGFLILLAIDRGSWISTNISGAKIQVGVGILALGVAILLALNLVPRALLPKSDDDSGVQPSWATMLSKYVSKVVSGSSPWFAAALGVGLAIPSVDYLALLVLIAASGLPLAAQAGVLMTFLTVANAILLIPIVSYLIDPQRTAALLENLRNWVLSRRQRDYAVLLGLIGVVMLAVGIHGLK